MSRSKEQNQAKLKEIYGFTFPDSLFWLHDFIVEQRDCADPIDLEAMNLRPLGALSLLLEYGGLDFVKFTGDPLLHYRYYCDIPEFFTYLGGDSDGLHWGMLLDNPSDGFRGVASHYNNDGGKFSVYRGVFDALIDHSEGLIESCNSYLLNDEENAIYYNKQIEIYEKFINRIEAFLAKNQLSRDEFRLLGLETSTGLDVISNDIFDRHQRVAVEMMEAGEKLWDAAGEDGDGEDRSDEAFETMTRAYKLLQEYKSMANYINLFDDLIAGCDHRIKFNTEIVSVIGPLDRTEFILSLQKQIDRSQKLKSIIEDFQERERRSDDRSKSLRSASDPEVELVADANLRRDSTAAIEMLRLGREFWYWNGGDLIIEADDGTTAAIDYDLTAEAYDLMRTAYQLLDRLELIRILDAHYHDRDRMSVDLVQR